MNRWREREGQKENRIFLKNCTETLDYVLILTISSLTTRLVSALKPIIAAIKIHPQLAMYAIPLQRVAVVRVMQQLSRVYR